MPWLHDLNASCHYQHKAVVLCLFPSHQDNPSHLDLLGKKNVRGKSEECSQQQTLETLVLISQIFPLQCQKRYFSAWHKLILDHRIKLGKAGTLSDWKVQLKVLRAWRDYTRSQKLGRETQAMENDLREENRYYYLYHENSSSMFIQNVFPPEDSRYKCKKHCSLESSHPLLRYDNHGFSVTSQTRKI